MFVSVIASLIPRATPPIPRNTHHGSKWKSSRKLPGSTVLRGTASDPFAWVSGCPFAPTRVGAGAWWARRRPVAPRVRHPTSRGPPPRAALPTPLHQVTDRVGVLLLVQEE